MPLTDPLRLDRLRLIRSENVDRHGIMAQAVEAALRNIIARPWHDPAGCPHLSSREPSGWGTNPRRRPSLLAEKITPSERRGIAAAFATGCLAFLAWAFPNMTRWFTIPGAVVCLCLTIYFLWPEIKSALSSRKKIGAAVVLILMLGGLLGAAFMATPANEDSSDTTASIPAGRRLLRMDRIVFVCNSPAKSGSADAVAKARDNVKGGVAIFNAATAMDMTFSEIDNGIAVELRDPNGILGNTFVVGMRYEMRRFKDQLIITSLIDMTSIGRVMFFISSPTGYLAEVRQNAAEKLAGVPYGSCKII
jgi:hypothetical protein